MYQKSVAIVLAISYSTHLLYNVHKLKKWGWSSSSLYYRYQSTGMMQYYHVQQQQYRCMYHTYSDICEKREVRLPHCFFIASIYLEAHDDGNEWSNSVGVPEERRWLPRFPLALNSDCMHGTGDAKFGY